MFVRSAQVALLLLGLSGCSSDWIAAQLTRLPEKAPLRASAPAPVSPEPSASLAPLPELLPVPSPSVPQIQVGGDVRINQQDVRAEINCPGVGNQCLIQNITQIQPADLPGAVQPGPQPVPSASSTPVPSDAPTAVPTPRPTATPVPEPEPTPTLEPTTEPRPASGPLGPVTVASFAQEGWSHEILRSRRVM